MFGSNAHYGHRAILTRYAGVPSDRWIPGLVQHGWNYDLGASPVDVRLPHPDPFFLWSERNLQNCRSAGVSDHVVPIGAPFLYMPTVAESVKAEPGSLLVMPFHGWELQRIRNEFEEYARATNELTRSFKTITICLYWFEYQDPAFRRPFEDLGFQVVTIGPRDNNPRFLDDLRSLMLKFEYVCSNRVATAGFYALMLGRKFFIHGPPAGLDGTTDRTGQLFHAWQTLEYPRLMWNGFSDECHKDIAESELGLSWKRDSAALRQLFLWEPEQKALLEQRVVAYRRRRDKGRLRKTATGLLRRLGFGL